MASKLFTWTKGDRSNGTVEALRSGRIVPIPVECIKIKGLDFARTEKGSTKASNRPSPLVIDGSPTPSSKHSSRTTNSIALHEAAVKSATTLMTIMNDMLHSPQLSAHIQSSHSHFGNLEDVPHRTRAYTAPSTPLVEIAQAMDPVELPGSMPGDSGVYLKLNPSQALAPSGFPRYAGEKIVRSHSSPQEASYPLVPRRGRMSVHSYYRDATSIYRSPRDNKAKPTEDLLPSYKADDIDSGPLAATFQCPAKQQILSSLPLEVPRPLTLPAALSGAPPESAYDTRTPTVPEAEDTSDRTDDATYLQVASDMTVREQIASMRASHDAYIRSLKKAHEREIASNQSYISLLESQQKLRPSEHIDLQRICSQKSSDVAQSDELCNPIREKEQEILRLNGMLQKSSKSEKALKDAVANLEARLVAANNERTDVLEGFNEASAKLQTLARREKILQQELHDLQGRFSTNRPAEFTPLSLSLPKPLRIRHKRTVSDVGASASTWPLSSQRSHDLPGAGLHSDQAQGAEIPGHPTSFEWSERTSTSRVPELQREIEQLKALLGTAQADAERYNSLLHDELRRQNRHVAEKSQPSLPSIDAEAKAISETRLSQLRTKSEHADPDASTTERAYDLQTSALISSLEKELQHCVKEIILYKLDVRGYKKDLKKANAKIENLEANKSMRPRTPCREALPSTRNEESDNSQRLQASESIERAAVATNVTEPGLGILLPDVAVDPIASSLMHPQRSRVAATPPPRFDTPLSPPATRSKTPLSTHKRLPKPPHFAMSGCSPPMTPPQLNSRSSETFRSFSESMVTSFVGHRARKS